MDPLSASPLDDLFALLGAWHQRHGLGAVVVLDTSAGLTVLRAGVDPADARAWLARAAAQAPADAS